MEGEKVKTIEKQCNLFWYKTQTNLFQNSIIASKSGQKKKKRIRLALNNQKKEKRK